MATKDDDKDKTPATPEVSFGTKAEYTAAVDAAVNKALAPKLKANKVMEEELKALRPLQAQVEKLQQTIDGGKQTDDQRHTAEMETLTKQVAGLQAQVEQGQTATATANAALHSSVGNTYLQGLAAEAGAAPTAIPDIPGLFPSAEIQVKPDASGRLVPMLVDPDTDLAQPDQKAAMLKFLATKPHLMTPPPNGAGQQGAGGGAPNTTKFEDLPPDEQVEAGLNEYFG